MNGSPWHDQDRLGRQLPLRCRSWRCGAASPCSVASVMCLAANRAVACEALRRWDSVLDGQGGLTTRPSALRKHGHRRRNSRSRSAKAAMQCTIRTGNPGDKNAEVKLQGDQRSLPVSLRRRRSGPPTTGSDMRPSRTAAPRSRWHGRRLRLLDGRHLRRPLRRYDGSVAERRRGTRRRARARLGPALQSRHHPGRRFPGQDGQPDDPDLDRLRGLFRLRRQARLEAAAMLHLRRPGARARPAGLLRHRAHLSGLPGPRRGRSTIRVPSCAGAGRVTRDRTLSVNIPARR